MVRTVSVTNGDGMPIEGLTADDFAVTEDGDPQEIAFVEFHRLSPGVHVPRASVPPSIPAPARREVREAPDSDRVLGGRRFASTPVVSWCLYFDLSAMPAMDGLRAYRGALTFLEQYMEPPDLVALMAFQRGVVRLRQDFTDDRQRLRREIETLIYADGRRDVESFDTASGGRRFRPERRRIQPVQHESSVVGVADGCDNARRAGPTDDAHLLRERTRDQWLGQSSAAPREPQTRAVLANVTINPVDARGLVALAPLGGRQHAVPGGRGPVLPACPPRRLLRKLSPISGCPFTRWLRKPEELQGSMTTISVRRLPGSPGGWSVTMCLRTTAPTPSETVAPAVFASP